MSIARRSVNATHINPSGSLLARRCRRWLVNISASKRLTSTVFVILVGVESARIEAAAPRLTVAGSKKYSSPVAILTKSERPSSCASPNVPSSAGCSLYRPAGFWPLMYPREMELLNEKMACPPCPRCRKYTPSRPRYSPRFLCFSSGPSSFVFHLNSFFFDLGVLLAHVM